MNIPEVPRRNPRAGETMLFLSDPLEPVQRFMLDIAPVSYGPPAHRHPSSSERFTVTSGSLAVRLGSAWHQLHSGDTVLVPPDKVHTYANTSQAPVTVEVVLDPGREMRGFFDAMYSLAEQGLLTQKGGLRASQAARLFRQFHGAMTIAGPPRPFSPRYGGRSRGLIAATEASEDPAQGMRDPTGGDTNPSSAVVQQSGHAGLRRHAASPPRDNGSDRPSPRDAARCLRSGRRDGERRCASPRPYSSKERSDAVADERFG